MVQLWHHALGDKDDLITEHQFCARSGQRAEKYKKIFAVQNSPEQELQITETTMRGEVYGSSETHVKVGRLISRPTKLI
ncbi:MAG: hypothetical protein COA61_010010 [Zetaproteobacteria bacterium]|nr:hypothetical protein [Zetaproteobacteria bacterium]